MDDILLHGRVDDRKGLRKHRNSSSLAGILCDFQYVLNGLLEVCACLVVAYFSLEGLTHGFLGS